MEELFPVERLFCQGVSRTYEHAIAFPADADADADAVDVTGRLSHCLALARSAGSLRLHSATVNIFPTRTGPAYGSSRSRFLAELMDGSPRLISSGPLSSPVLLCTVVSLLQILSLWLINKEERRKKSEILMRAAAAENGPHS